MIDTVVKLIIIFHTVITFKGIKTTLVQYNFYYDSFNFILFLKESLVIKDLIQSLNQS